MAKARGPFSAHGRLRSFQFAWAGLRHFMITEHNGWMHAAATLLVIAAGFAVRLPLDEWRWIVVAVAFVWIAEALNTAIERLADAVTVERDENIGLAKDVAAGAVLIASLAAAIIGIMIFSPRIAALVP